MIDTTFKERIIEANIKIGDTGDEITLSGLRMRANVAKSQQASVGNLQLQIYGLTLEMMNRLTVIGFYRNEIVKANEIMVTAGNKGEALSIIHTGIINVAYADVSAPEAVFNIVSHAATASMISADDATSYKGQAKVSDIMADLATKAGLKLEDKGVKKTLDNQVLKGSYWDKITALARAAGIGYAIDNGTLLIWEDENLPQSGKKISSNGDLIMLGYPTASNSGIMVRTLFAPEAKVTDVYEVESELKIANGQFWPNNINHELDCYFPNGVWQTVMQMSRR